MYIKRQLFRDLIYFIKIVLLLVIHTNYIKWEAVCLPVYTLLSETSN
jgi:hypothetical protein